MGGGGERRQVVGEGPPARVSGASRVSEHPGSAGQQVGASSRHDGRWLTGAKAPRWQHGEAPERGQEGGQRSQMREEEAVGGRAACKPSLMSLGQGFALLWF